MQLMNRWAGAKRIAILRTLGQHRKREQGRWREGRSFVPYEADLRNLLRFSDLSCVFADVFQHLLRFPDAADMPAHSSFYEIW